MRKTPNTIFLLRLFTDFGLLILGHLGKVNSLLLHVSQGLHVWAVMEGAVAELGGGEVVS